MLKTGSFPAQESKDLCLALHTKCPKQQHIYSNDIDHWMILQAVISNTVFIIFDQWIIFSKTITTVINLKMLFLAAPLWYPLRLRLCYQFVFLRQGTFSCSVVSKYRKPFISQPTVTQSGFEALITPATEYDLGTSSRLEKKVLEPYSVP